jgi:tRNA (guanosine-2'-O-)-methyltransferase
VARWCDQQGRPYPALTAEGEIAESLPRDVRLPH